MPVRGVTYFQYLELHCVRQSPISFLPRNDTNISVTLVDLLTFVAKAFAFCTALCADLILSIQPRMFSSELKFSSATAKIVYLKQFAIYDINSLLFI